MSAPARPSNLGKRGKRLWSQITKSYDLRLDELRILEDACREVDLIERLEDDTRDRPLTVSGSMGQPVAAPSVQELRQHRALLARLLGSLKLPDETAEAGGSAGARSTEARERAAARWGRGA